MVALCSEVRIEQLDENFGRYKANLVAGDLVWDGRARIGHVMVSATECECGDVDLEAENILVLARHTGSYLQN